MSVISDSSKYVAWNVVKFKFDVVKLPTRSPQIPVKLFCSTKIKSTKTQVRIFVINLPRFNFYFCSRSPGVYLVFDVRGWGLFKAHITQVVIIKNNKSHKNILSRILVVAYGILSHEASSPCPLPYPYQVSHLVAETCLTTNSRLIIASFQSGRSSQYPLYWVTLVFYTMTIFSKMFLVLTLSRVCWKSPRLRENFPIKVSCKFEESQILNDNLRLRQTLTKNPGGLCKKLTSTNHRSPLTSVPCLRELVLIQVREIPSIQINYKVILRILFITCLGSPQGSPSTLQPPPSGCPRTSPSPPPCYNLTSSPSNVTEVPCLKELSPLEVNKKLKNYKKINKSQIDRLILLFLLSRFLVDVPRLKEQKPKKVRKLQEKLKGIYSVFFSSMLIKSKLLRSPRLKGRTIFQVNLKSIYDLYNNLYTPGEGQGLLQSWYSVGVDTSTKTEVSYNKNTKVSKLNEGIIRLYQVWMMVELSMFFLMMTMLSWHVVMKSVHGNITKIQIAHQNLPGVLSSTNKQTSIEELLQVKKPHVLALSEPRYSELTTFSFPGYVLVKGMQAGVKDPRLNVLVQERVQHVVVNFVMELPTVHLKIGSQHVIFMYREGRKLQEDGISKRKGGRLLSRNGGRSKDVSSVWVTSTLTSGDPIQNTNRIVQS